MSEVRTSPLFEIMLQAGGVVADYHGWRVVRHFGDAAGEYAAATTGLAVFDRSHRARLTVSGKAPLQMLGDRDHRRRRKHPRPGRRARAHHLAARYRGRPGRSIALMAAHCSKPAAFARTVAKHAFVIRRD